MNKFKIISIVLGVSLFVALVRLVYVSTNSDSMSDTDNVLRNISNRVDVKNFSQQSVNREQLDTMMHAAMAAPSSWEECPWGFMVLDDRQMIDNLAEKMSQTKLIKAAPAVIVVCGDKRVIGLNDEQMELWEYDCSMASENILLAAQAMGLGTAWMKVSSEEEEMSAVQDALELPRFIIPLNVIPVGYPAAKSQPQDKYNADNIHFNEW